MESYDHIFLQEVKFAEVEKHIDTWIELLLTVVVGMM